MDATSYRGTVGGTFSAAGHPQTFTVGALRSVELPVKRQLYLPRITLIRFRRVEPGSPETWGRRP